MSIEDLMESYRVGLLMAAKVMQDTPHLSLLLKKAAAVPDVSAPALAMAAIADTLLEEGDPQALVELNTTVLGGLHGQGSMDRMYALGGYLGRSPTPYRWGLVLVKGLQHGYVEGIVDVVLAIEAYVDNPGNVNDLVAGALKGSDPLP